MWKHILPRLPVLILALPGTLHAQLQWEATTRESQVTLEDTEVTAEFPFTNAGTAPVTITKLEPTCGCTVAKLAKKTYQPGESGKVTAVFDFGERQGLQQKVIKVTTDEPGSPVTNLMIKVEIPAIVDITPLAIWWKKGDTKPQPIHFKVLLPSPIRITKVRVKSPRILTVVKTIEEGKSYEVIVTPTDAEQKLRETLTIDTDFRLKHRKSYPVYLLID